MMEEHSRFAIWNQSQHPYRHSPTEFLYINPALPGVTNMESALNWILAVLYPQSKPDVATPGDLPGAGNAINDYRVVRDDGDGKAASYRWEKREGEVSASWHKVYDMDWGVDAVLSHFINQTQDMYVFKLGSDDRDPTGAYLTGKDAGQIIFGGASANTHLTLCANSGDDTGAQTGFIQLYGHTRPYDNAAYDLGTSAEKFRDLYLSRKAYVGTMGLEGGLITDSSGAISFDNENLSTTGTITGSSVLAGTATLTGGSLTDSSGAFSFGDENLSTSGTLNSGSHTIGNLVLASAQITNSTGTISFDDENLVTTGNLSGTQGIFGQVNVDNLRLDGNTISSTDANGNILLVPNGTGVVDVQKAMTTLAITATGIVSVTGQLNADNIRLDGNTISSTDADGSITLAPNGTGNVILSKVLYPATNLDLGKALNPFKDFFLSGSLNDGTNGISIGTLLSFRRSLFRDIAQTQPAQNGDVLFYNSASGVWLASSPDTEIDHGTLTGLTDDDHSQYLLLAGRTGGQTIIGGTDAGNDLSLESTSHATKGSVLTKSTFSPFTDASYSGTWSGTDLGSSLKRFRDIYTKGELKGLRFENFVSSGLPASSAANVGRVIYETDTKKLKVDDGSAFRVAGVSKYASDISFDGIVTTKNVDVSANIQDARNAIIQLLDNANDFERIHCTIKATSTSNVRIQTTPALPAGSYRLIVIE